VAETTETTKRYVAVVAQMLGETLESYVVAETTETTKSYVAAEMLAETTGNLEPHHGRLLRGVRPQRGSRPDGWWVK